VRSLSKAWDGDGFSGKTSSFLDSTLLTFRRIVAIVVGFCGSLLFFFVPETFWDRTPRAKKRPLLGAHRTLSNIFNHALHPTRSGHGAHDNEKARNDETAAATAPKRHKHVHVGFADGETGEEQDKIEDEPQAPSRPAMARLESTHSSIADDLAPSHADSGHETPSSHTDVELAMQRTLTPDGEFAPKGPQRYTTHLRSRPPMKFTETLKPWNGRLNHANWFKVMIRPFILFAYPSVLWSTLVYSLSVGWLIVLSESVSHIYRNKKTYNFSALGTGLVYLSPFIGGVLGTAVAGKVSDIIIRYMSRRNGGIYEPEFRLVMGLPVALATATGLMGFGWSAQEKDLWIVPTIFFGIISFGCSLGSTTAITFCVDSYRQYAGEALVTLNFSKSEFCLFLLFPSFLSPVRAILILSDVFHGLVFSVFFVNWLDSDGSKDVFLIIGGLQLACLTTTIPMYIYGKRARMWTVRKNLMEKF
jgi:hypothetical protein